MEIKRQELGDKEIIRLIGEIDGSNVDSFEAVMTEASQKCSELEVDLEKLEYVSSAGLRVFLITEKQMKQDGKKMIIKNVGEEIMDIFTVTGFVKLLNIER
jgi:anti-sigma B factor antagonist